MTTPSESTQAPPDDGARRNGPRVVVCVDGPVPEGAARSPQPMTAATAPGVG